MLNDKQWAAVAGAATLGTAAGGPIAGAGAAIGTAAGCAAANALGWRDEDVPNRESTKVD